MRRAWKLGILAILTTVAFASDATARTHSRAKQTANDERINSRHHRSYLRSLGARGWLTYAPRSYRASRGRGAHFATLVGAPDGGLGFYPLPLPYRIGAWRYRLRHQRPPWQNPVLFAIMADAARYYYDWVPANQGYRYGVFDPIEGVGTPFFAGFYGPAGPDEERPFPFGRPYTR